MVPVTVYSQNSSVPGVVSSSASETVVSSKACYNTFLLLCDRKTRCIPENGTEMSSTEVEYESNSSKMMATYVYLSFQHVSSA